MKGERLVIFSLVVGIMTSNTINTYAYTAINDVGENKINYITSSDGLWQYDVVDYDTSKIILKPKNSSVKTGDVTVPEMVDGYTVIAVGDSAWSGAGKLTSIVLPDTVKEIGKSAFSGASSLTDIKMNEIYVMGEAAFSNCRVLNNINLDNITAIEKNVLSGCYSLENIVLPDTVTEVDLNYLPTARSNALEYVEGKEYAVEITNSNTTVTFTGNSTYSQLVNKLIVPYGSKAETFIASGNSGMYTWYGEELFMVYQKNTAGYKANIAGINYIGEELSSDGKWLYVDTGKGGVTIKPADSLIGEVIIPKTVDGYKVIEIYPGAFANMDVTLITIPEGVTKIGGGAFANNKNLTNAYFLGNGGAFGNNVFTGSSNVTVNASNGSTATAYANSNSISTSTDMSGVGTPDDSNSNGSGGGEETPVDYTISIKGSPYEGETLKAIVTPEPTKDIITYTWKNIETKEILSETDSYVVEEGLAGTDVVVYLYKNGETSHIGKALITIKEKASNGKTEDTSSSVENKEISKDEIYSGTEGKTEVYAGRGSTFTITIPEKITLNGGRGEENSAHYEVTVKGDIAGDEVINVVPDGSFKISQKGKHDIQATNTMKKTAFSIAEDTMKELNRGVSTEGIIKVESITAGEWNGVFDFEISVTKEKE